MKDKYLIEVKKRNCFENDKIKRVIVSKECLAGLLTTKKYQVFNAVWIDSAEYQRNHEEKLEVWE